MSSKVSQISLARKFSKASAVEVQEKKKPVAKKTVKKVAKKPAAKKTVKKVAKKPATKKTVKKVAKK